ncbi:hypothetical protein NXS19_004159 [Fusarium pseudograminearum]|nr:hypothetical protein NXS19_004159 [Fusarium pseudograminearum]
MSPMSSMTMKLHRAKAKAKEEKEKKEQEAHDMLQGLVTTKPRSKQRDTSESDDESYFNPRRRRRGDGSSSDEAVEDLPDRFDKQGKPLDERSTRSRGWTSRRGDFEYKPKRRNDMDIKGAWQVAGTDGEAVEQIVRGVTGALEGKGGWLGILGNVLGGLQQPDQREAIDDGRSDERRRRRRHRD